MSGDPNQKYQINTIPLSHYNKTSIQDQFETFSKAQGYNTLINLCDSLEIEFNYFVSQKNNCSINLSNKDPIIANHGK